ncbi:MAG TPA: DUF1269 domain-containing protein [Ktedonobacterales bacterium]|nr:DUF1269 domain-containing protein [Ktedonobacterales bacterium]
MSKESDVPVEVVLAAFNDEDGAEKALGELKQAKKDRLIGIRNAAVLWKDDKGKLHFKETADMRGGKGAVIGGVIGGVVGLVFPPSILASAAVGAAIGGFSAKLHDAGFPDDRLREVGKGLKPNTSALIAVIEDVWVREVEAELRQYGADVVTEAVRADIASQLESEKVEVPVAGSATTGATNTTATASDTSASSASTQGAATPGTSTPDTSTTAPASGETPPPESTASGSDTGPNPA